MSGRAQIMELLNQLEDELKRLEIAYEQYFIGVEKRAPENERTKLTKLFRKMVGKYIPQTDLKFRLRGLTSRFNSYCGYWDRILRLIEEGKYERHTSRMQQRPLEDTPAEKEPAPKPAEPILDSLYNQLVDAHDGCQMKSPSREQVAWFLEKQEAAIKQRFGDRLVEYTVAIESGKPKIKVRAKS